MALQLVVHWCVVVLHASPAAQSPALLQPHAPDGRQALPLALPAQLLQTLPTAPHAACVVPGWQLPLVLDEQQPDWHAVAAEQEFTHRLLAQLDAPVAQSPSDAQPHWPPPVVMMQRWPFWLLAQLLHSPPLLPQNEGLALPL